MSDDRLPPAGKYSRYKQEVGDDIVSTVKHFGCQPILFIGSGLAKRYMGAPNWNELLSYVVDKCPSIEKGLGFYKQAFKTPMRIGEEFARIYQEWAWGPGKSTYPDNLFEDNIDGQTYIKYTISEYLKSITPNSINDLVSEPHVEELKSLQRIRPHAVITTNYDQMLEKVFPDLEPIIGQSILRGQQISVGEIYKIHGCVSKGDTIIFTQSDYNNFIKKKKFLSAKLLTFFNEHPLIFVGYSASDPEIKSILSDVDEALSDKGGIIPNVYILEWNPLLNEDSYPAKEKVLPTEDDRTIRVKLIEALDFSWVFDALAANPALDNVSPRVMRALLARSYNLVRCDIPRMTVQADFKMLTDSVENPSSFAKLFGIANVDDYSAASAQHPLSPTQLAVKLKLKSWHKVNDLIRKLTEVSGINIRQTDNKYHRAEKINKVLFTNTQWKRLNC